MQKELLRLVSQKRFKLMNRWNAEAAKHQCEFGAVEDHVFRSFIFRAFEHLTEELRRASEQAETGEKREASLLDKFEFPNVPEIEKYRDVLEIGIHVVDAFLSEDSTCCARFSGDARDRARQALKDGGIEFLEKEAGAHRRLFPSARESNLICMKCGQPLPEE